MLARSAYRAILNFYPRPPGGGRPEYRAKWYGETEISIHALRVEGDLRLQAWRYVV